MEYIQPYKSFLYSHNLTDGIRVTAGILVPAFVMLYFNMLPIGIVMSIGALCVSVTDIPGPIRYRRNEMMICIGTIFIVTIYVGLASYSAVATGVILTIFCFFFSMLGIYGNRAGSIGLAALLVMVLNFNFLYRGVEIFLNAFYILAGGIWYFLFSISVHRLRPYKLVQQAMGDYVQSIADYLRIRAMFYQREVNYENTYKELLHKQINVQQHHELVSELIFKTRDIVKSSTHTGRILVMIFLEASELFDRIMTSYQDYAKLHEVFDETSILQDFHQLALSIAAELDEIGLSLKAGTTSKEDNELFEQINKGRIAFQKLRSSYLKPENIDGFINLRRILDNIQDIANRLHTLHQYTGFDRKLKKQAATLPEAEHYITQQEISVSKLWDSLSPESNIFRHSLRVTVAALAGYLLSKFLPIGHSYWILLTVIVILKPAYSLTQQRNKDRLIGTVSGAVLGVTIIFLFKNHTLLLVLMIAFMTASNILIRTKYFLAVLMMTVYLLILFYLLEPANFPILLKDRIIDTGIGSVIAFITSILVLPDWERKSMKSYMLSMLEDNREYFRLIAERFYVEEKADYSALQVARKRALVSLANLSDAFNRMLSEPESQRKQIEKIHQFVVLNHRLTSHISTLSHYYHSQMKMYGQVDLQPVVDETVDYLNKSMQHLNKLPVPGNMAEKKDALMQLYEEVNILLETRRQELRAGQLETGTKKTLSEMKSIVDQFKFIFKIAAELEKLSASVELA
jgi:uncharacterized membrane protein (TIGR01666 family)